ncbi:MAG: hypothetical protein ACK5M1_04325 [Xanthomarina gelatinilytica]
MLRKVKEFFVEMDDFCIEFSSQLENRPLLEGFNFYAISISLSSF